MVTDNPMATESLSIRALSNSNRATAKSVSVTVCGFEVISITAAGKAVAEEFYFDYGPEAGYKTVAKTSNMFTSSSTRCPVFTWIVAYD